MQKGEIVSTLLDLLKVPSYTGYERGDVDIADYVVQFLNRHGIEAELQEVDVNQVNVIAQVCRGSLKNAKTILFVSHLDTVSPEGMEVPPFGALSKNVIYGRGAVDMKGGLTAALWCLVELTRTRSFKGRVLFLGDANEEDGNTGAMHFLYSRDFDYDYAIIGEPTNLRIAVAHKGVCWVNVRFSGKTAHAAFPNRGSNAIMAGAEFIRLLDLEVIPLLKKRHHSLLGNPTLNIGVIRGGERPNIVPHVCDISIDRRYIPTESKEEALAQLAALAQRVAQKYRSSCSVTEMPQTADPPHDAFYIPENDDIVIKVRSLLRRAGIDDKPRCVPFWTEAPLFSKGGLKKVLILGPGDPALAHAPDERVAVQEVFTASNVYYQICQELG